MTDPVQENDPIPPLPGQQEEAPYTLNTGTGVDRNSLSVKEQIKLVLENTNPLEQIESLSKILTENPSVINLEKCRKADQILMHYGRRFDNASALIDLVDTYKDYAEAVCSILLANPINPGSELEKKASLLAFQLSDPTVNEALVSAKLAGAINEALESAEFSGDIAPDSQKNITNIVCEILDDYCYHHLPKHETLDVEYYDLKKLFDLTSATEGGYGKEIFEHMTLDSHRFMVNSSLQDQKWAELQPFDRYKTDGFQILRDEDKALFQETFGKHHYTSYPDENGVRVDVEHNRAAMMIVNSKSFKAMAYDYILYVKSQYGEDIRPEVVKNIMDQFKKLGVERSYYRPEEFDYFY